MHDVVTLMDTTTPDEIRAANAARIASERARRARLEAALAALGESFGALTVAAAAARLCHPSTIAHA